MSFDRFVEVESKRCICCERELPVTEFRSKNKITGKRHGKCSDCLRAYYRDYYKKNGSAWETKYVPRMRERIRELKDFIREYLQGHPCVDCGEDDIRVLEFDHVRGRKFQAVTKMTHSGYGVEKLAKEIEKCEVRCCNCHRRRHVKDSWRDI